MALTIMSYETEIALLENKVCCIAQNKIFATALNVFYCRTIHLGRVLRYLMRFGGIYYLHYSLFNCDWGQPLLSLWCDIYEMFVFLWYCWAWLSNEGSVTSTLSDEVHTSSGATILYFFITSRRHQSEVGWGNSLVSFRALRVSAIVLLAYTGNLTNMAAA